MGPPSFRFKFRAALFATDIDHAASQEFLGQSDGPLGSQAARVLAVELVEGDTSDSALLRKVGAAKPPKLMVYFYDAWADSAQHLAKNDVLEVCFGKRRGYIYVYI